MVKEHIPYVDYDGNPVEEDAYFNLTKAEIAEMEFSNPNGGFEAMLRNIIKEKDHTKVIPIFKQIIRKSYGVKSEDGRRFIKSEQLSDEFMQTEAYSELFVKLFSDSDALVHFMNGLVPGSTPVSMEEIEAQVSKLEAEAN